MWINRDHNRPSSLSFLGPCIDRFGEILSWLVKRKNGARKSLFTVPIAVIATIVTVCFFLPCVTLVWLKFWSIKQMF